MDDSTLGLGLNNPQYQDLITKQQEAIKAANQPYGMDAGQGAIAAGLGLLPALIGGLVRGKEGLSLGAQAGMAGVSSYDNILKENFDRKSKAEAANAALYGQQAQAIASQDLGLQRALQMEDIKQDNRIELRGIPQERIIVGGKGSLSKEPVSALVQAELARVTGKPIEDFAGITKGDADILLKGKQISQRDSELDNNTKAQERMQSETERRQKQFDVQMAGLNLPGFEYNGKEKVPRPEDYKASSARLTGTRIIVDNLNQLRKSMEVGGQDPWTGKEAARQEMLLKRIAESFRTMNNAGASLTDSEQELSRIVQNTQNVGMVESAKRSALFGKKPLEAVDLLIPQLKRESLIYLGTKGYNPVAPTTKPVVVDSAAFNKLSGGK